MTEEFNRQWWTIEDPLERGDCLWKTLLYLYDEDKRRQAMNEHHERLYTAQPLHGELPREFYKIHTRHRVSMNVVANQCDFVTNRLAKNIPLVKPVPMDGDFEARENSKMLDLWFRAQWRLSKVPQAFRQGFHDSTRLGTGIVKSYVDPMWKKICVECVHPSEVILDHSEARDGNPLQLYQIHYISRKVLEEMIESNESLSKKEKEKALKALRYANTEDDYSEPHHRIELAHVPNHDASDLVQVVEAYHLRTAPDAKDGIRTYAVQGGILWEDEWKFDYLPYTFLRWKPRPFSFWGIGLAEALYGKQVEINRLLARIQAAFQLLGKPYIITDGIVDENAMRDDEYGRFVRVNGGSIQVITPNAIHPDIFNHLQWLIDSASSETGLNQDTVSPKFSGEESGIARNMRYDIESERFSTPVIRLEEEIEEFGKRLVDRAKELYEIDKNFGLAAATDRETIKRIKWSDIDLKDDQYVLMIEGVSGFSDLPSIRLEQVMSLFQAGLVDVPQALELMNFPDTDRFFSMSRAARDNIERILDDMLKDEDIFHSPEPLYDLQLAMKLTQDKYNWAQVNNVPEEAQQKLRMFAEKLHELNQSAMLAQQQMAAAAQLGTGTPAPEPGAAPPVGVQGAPPTAVQG